MDKHAVSTGTMDVILQEVINAKNSGVSDYDARQLGLRLYRSAVATGA